MPRMIAIFAALFLLVGPCAPASAQSYATVDERGIPTIAPLLDKVTDAVVSIAVISQQPVQTNPLSNDPLFQELLGSPTDPPVLQRQLNAGSGVIVDAQQGYILTNSHLLLNGVAVTVTLKDRRSFDAAIIGLDSATDIALVQIDAPGLSDVPMGDSSRLRVGDLVVAVGNPFGLGQAVSTGIISALGRSGFNPEGFEDLIQTDASINPGNSGGALVTMDGNLIGINSIIVSPIGGNVGIGFSVPINMARTIMAQLIAFGEVRRGQLGVSTQTLTPDVAQGLGWSVMRGAVVTQVQSDSAAAKAGLLPGDVITKVNGIPIFDAGDLRTRVGLTPVGETMEIVFLRQGVEMTATAMIQSPQCALDEAASIAEFDALQGARFSLLAPGMPDYGKVEGVVVQEIARNSPAQMSGLRQGDIILSVNNQPVRTPAELHAALPEKRQMIAVTYFRQGETIFQIVRCPTGQ